jgi:hypothetical protein
MKIRAAVIGISDYQDADIPNLRFAERDAEAFTNFKSLAFWYPVPEPILQEPLFKKIRKTKRFKEMMKRNFPEQN